MAWPVCRQNDTILWYTGPRTAVGNVSGYRCVSDCRSRSREFDPGPVLYFRGDWSWNNFYGKKGCCQLQAKVCAQITGYPLVQACPGKSVVRWTDRPAMTIAVDLGHKATKQTNKQSDSMIRLICNTAAHRWHTWQGEVCKQSAIPYSESHGRLICHSCQWCTAVYTHFSLNCLFNNKYWRNEKR